VRRSAVTAAAFALLLALAPTGAMASGKNCLADAAETLLFVDHTTPLTALDQKQLFDGTNLIVERMPVGGRLTVKTIPGSYAEVRTIFQDCKPGCPPGAGALACSDIVARRRDFPLFVRGIEGALKEIFAHPGAARSEIAISLAYGLRSSSEGRARRVYVFSDMLERSSLLDMMASASPFVTGRNPEAMAALSKRVVAAGFDTRLDGAEVTVFGFGREDGSHKPLDIQVAQRVRTFWTRLFTEMGARSVTFFSDLSR